MTYWRQETFEALEHAASSASGRWPGYAEYARLQGKGLRKKALALVPALAEDLAGREWTQRWEFVWWLHTEALLPGVVEDSLAPHVLRQRVVVPTLKEALRDERTACPEAYLWLVQHHREALAVTGIQRFPGDERLRRALADRLLGYAEHSAESLVRAWQRWSAEGRSGDFPAWCGSQGLQPPAEGVTIYYGPKT